MTTRSFAYDPQRAKILALLVLSTLFCLALIGVRLQVMGIGLPDLQQTEDIWALRNTTTFLFLVWNLFLAWIPYGIALALEPLSRRFRSSLLSVTLVLAWLLFFPNAPYILTDLLHLRVRHPIPHWYDLMLIASFAWTGLLLGFLSLHEVQGFVARRWGKVVGGLFSTGAIFLGGLGIYLGRYLRWNTWDILRNPFSIVGDAWTSLWHPAQHSGEGIIWVSAIFLLLGYWTLRTLMGGASSISSPKNKS